MEEFKGISWEEIIKKNVKKIFLQKRKSHEYNVNIQVRELPIKTEFKEESFKILNLATQKHKNTKMQKITKR